MNIAIIANDKKKELVTEFCIAYCGILSRHRLCATAITCKYISEATGLHIEKLLPGARGGSEQIASKVIYGEVDLLILLRDTDHGGSAYTRTRQGRSRLARQHEIKRRRFMI